MSDSTQILPNFLRGKKGKALLYLLEGGDSRLVFLREL